jgi:hypothetical protein
MARTFVGAGDAEGDAVGDGVAVADSVALGEGDAFFLAKAGEIPKETAVKQQMAVTYVVCFILLNSCFP